MNVPALIRSSQHDVYMALTVLGCTVNCRFRFADCPLIHCGYVVKEVSDLQSPAFVLQGCQIGSSKTNKKANISERTEGKLPLFNYIT